MGPFMHTRVATGVIRNPLWFNGKLRLRPSGIKMYGDMTTCKRTRRYTAV